MANKLITRAWRWLAALLLAGLLPAFDACQGSNQAVGGPRPRSR
jgi:hypothetical protein